MLIDSCSKLAYLRFALTINSRSNCCEFCF